MLQSLFTWIFYLFESIICTALPISLLQSLFTWIFYLFKKELVENRNRYIASILIHLDFLSIYISMIPTQIFTESFNPYSPGFSIYFDNAYYLENEGVQLQSLFTWIFYLFQLILWEKWQKVKASILIHLDFLSIYIYKKVQTFSKKCFNPYSPGFSIYLNKILETTMAMSASILIHLDFLSIYRDRNRQRGYKLHASILIHLDFLSILKMYTILMTHILSFNPYSPGFSIYFKQETN